jgi:cysteinyl-tRNA synthetase
VTWIDDVLGLDLAKSTPDISDEQKRLIIERVRAREAKDWQKSDELRDELQSSGIDIRDTPDGSIWSYA